MTSRAGKIWVFSGGRRTMVILTGEIDASMDTELHQAVHQAEAAGAQVQVDASGLTFLDSTGITALARLAIRTPGPLILFGASDAVQFLLEVTHLKDLVDLRPDHAVPEPHSPLPTCTRVPTELG